jgi:hypothetical protein
MIQVNGCTNQNNGGTNPTPARNVTGKWIGSPVFTDRAYECAYDERWEQCQECDSFPAVKLIGMVSLKKEH